MALVSGECSGSGEGAASMTAEGERVVISGMSGLYPNAHHVKDFADILYNKINPVTSDNARYECDHPEVSQYVGTVPDLQYFDAQFFKVHYRLGNNMDAMGRKVLEQSYQAIYDAGVCPGLLSGKKVGVYIGSCFSETEKACFYVATSRTGFGIPGCSKTMFANRISYWLNAKGPSMAVDQACSSSTAALEMAYHDIMQGECEAAIVGGANLCLHPQSLVQLGRVINLSKDGKTKSFAEDAKGCAKSEAINVLFLQKAKHALRIYAEVVFIKTQFTSLLEGQSGPRYGFSRNPKDTIKFLKEFYDEARTPPQAVEFVEAWGSAVPESDKAELEAIEEIFCQGRSDPLLVGSVMSNIGYGEAASGITAITKVLLGYHTGEMAANLHCSRPRRDVAALRDGRMRVATEHARLRRSYVAVNGLSVTGVNSHVLLHGCYKPKDGSRYKSTIPHLVLISGRQDSAVKKVLDYLKSCPIDPEELALLHNIHLTRISGHLGRGYSVLGTNDQNETVSLSEEVDYFDDVKRPLWFVYSGMGSQWAGMGEHLMRISVFAAAIEKCHRVLQPKGLDIVHIITTRDKTIFDNILHSFVGIAAIQIGLTDVLTELGMVPDKIIGHSVGELGCAYADGCFTAEEMILSAYSRGLVSVETPFIRGAMAAVGIGYQQIISMCPPGIEVACHNSTDSCTISGPAGEIHEFLKRLVDNNIFAKEVPCSNIAYHSRYIADAGPSLLKYLSEVIKCPKRRSERWISTSVPMDRWNEQSAKYSSAEYHTNNLLRPVLFEESSRLVPANAVLVEVAPHGLLQAILRRSLPDTCQHIPLTRRGHSDNARLVLEAIGKLYISGFNPKVQALYPKIEFPVSTGTPMLSHLVEWAHNQNWDLPLYTTARRNYAVATRLVISIHDHEHGYLQGHVIKGQILYPFAASLVAVWDTLAMSRGAVRRQLPVQFRQVSLHAQPVLHDRRQLRLAVALHRGTGRFEVIDDVNSLVTSGFIDTQTDHISAQEDVVAAALDITSKEIYNNFNFRDLYYSDCFKSIHSVNSNITEALIMWRDNWVTFLDGLIQLNLLKHSLSSHSRPSFIGKLIIDPEVQCFNNNSIKKATLEDNYNITRCEGVLMENIKFHYLPTSEKSPSLKELKFIPHYSTAQFDFATILQVYMQIVIENVDQDNIHILGFYEDSEALTKLNEIKYALADTSGVRTHCNWFNRDSMMENHDVLSKTNLAIVFNMTTDDQIYQSLSKVLQYDTFVINIENTTTDLTKVTRPIALNQVVCRHEFDFRYLELHYWQTTRKVDVTEVVILKSPSDFSIISDKQESILPHQEIIVLTTHPAPEGLKEYLNNCRNTYGRKFRLVMSNNGNYGELNTDILKNVKLAINVVENDVLGGEYFVPLQNIIRANKEVTLRSSVIGQLESVCWEEASPKKETGIPIKVHFAGLNDLDAKRAAGIIPFDTNNINKGYGMDFSGVTESGERVMGLVANDAASSSVQACPELLWPVPEHWSLEDAATVPLAYCLAYYCLTIRYPLMGGERVLVHAGAGALGQAVIAIALALDCEVFTTVGDMRKKQFLLNMFPALKAENIGNSRDISFYYMVLNATNGKGVDFAICNLQGELKTASMKCVGRSGITIDVVQIPSRENYDFPMDYMRKERSYVSINFSSIFNENENGKSTQKRLQRLVCEGIARGWVRPLSRVVCGADEGPRALRLLAAANQRGRVLLRLTNDTTDTHTHQQQLDILPRIRCSSDQWHVIISDHDRLGLHLADRLVSRGVRKLHLYTTALPEDLKLKIGEWESAGVQVNCEALCTSDVPDSFIESRSLEPVEGIYIVITKKTIPALVSAAFVRKMDMVLRKLFTDVKYFAVINSANSIGAETCQSRALNQLAGTMIKLPEIKEVCGEQCEDVGQISCYEAAAVAERALCTTAAVLSTSFTRQPRLSLLQQIARVAGVTIPEDTEDTATLSDLGLEPVKITNVCIFLRDTHNVFLSLEDIQSLTVQRVKDIGDTLSKTNFEDDKGLETLFSYVDSDELLATTEMVFLPTLANNSTMRADEFDVNETYLCIVPGVEGHHARFRTLCERLRLPALVLQPGLHLPHESARETVLRYGKILLEKAGLKTRFYLLGYESGVLVALELAAVLEDNGLTGTVFCLGLPPSEFTGELRQQLSGLEREEALQDAVVRHTYGLMTGAAGGAGGVGGVEDLSGALQSATSWDEKVEAAVRLLLGRVPHSAQYARQLMEAARTRLTVLLRQEEGPARALRSRLVLLQPAPGPALVAQLQPHSQQPVAAHALRAPLTRAAQDLRCAAIINSYLDEDILRYYENKNHCESYLINTDCFMSTT